MGIPLTNPMGWCSSLLSFNACTKTVVDLANASLEDPFEQVKAQTASHWLDTISEMAPLEDPPVTTTGMPFIPYTTPFKEKPLRYWDIYIDEFCGVVQGNCWARCWMKRTILPSLDMAFHPLDNLDNKFRQ